MAKVKLYTKKQMREYRIRRQRWAERLRDREKV